MISQQHIFFNANLGTEHNVNIYVPAFVTFKVKKIKFGFSYTVNADDSITYIVTSDITNNDVIGVLNKFSVFNGVGNIIYCDSFSESKNMSYIFRNPIDVNGNIKLNFRLIENATNIISSNIIIHMEFLSE